MRTSITHLLHVEGEGWDEGLSFQNTLTSFLSLHMARKNNLFLFYYTRRDRACPST